MRMSADAVGNRSVQTTRHRMPAELHKLHGARASKGDRGRLDPGGHRRGRRQERAAKVEIEASGASQTGYRQGEGARATADDGNHGEAIWAGSCTRSPRGPWYQDCTEENPFAGVRLSRAEQGRQEGDRTGIQLGARGRRRNCGLCSRGDPTTRPKPLF